MTLSCEHIEARLSDYLEGSLSADERDAFEAHTRACARCAPLLAGVSQLVVELHSMEQVPAPPRLVYAILDKTIGPRESRAGWRALFAWKRDIPGVQFAYGALSVVATFAIFLTAAGFNWRRPKLADLQPASLYRRANSQAHLVYARSTKFVSDLRVVYEIQSRLRQDEMPTTPEPNPPESTPQNQPPHSDGSKPASPRQQNRADDIARHVVFAAALPILNGGLGDQFVRRRVP
jgi:anti-sigma factor RsiW